MARKLCYEHLPLIHVYYLNEWVQNYDYLLKAREDAKLLILVTEIEQDLDAKSKYNLHGEGAINIVFNNDAEDYQSIQSVIPKEIIQTMLKKYSDYDLVPNRIQLYFRNNNTYRLSYHFELVQGEDKCDVIRVESSFDEFNQILIYFLYFSNFWYKMTFEDENSDNLIYDDVRTPAERKTIIKTIKNMMNKNLKI